MTGYDDAEQAGFLRRLLDGGVADAIERALERRETIAEPKAFLEGLGIAVPDGIRVGIEEREVSDRDLDLPGLPDLPGLGGVPPVRWRCFTFCFPRSHEIFYLERCVRFCFLG